MSLKKQLYAYLKARPDTWIHKSELSRYAEGLGFMGENGTRRVRELVEESGGKIIQTEKDTKEHGKTAFYQYVSGPHEKMNLRYQQTGQLRLVV